MCCLENGRLSGLESTEKVFEQAEDDRDYAGHFDGEPQLQFFQLRSKHLSGDALSGLFLDQYGDFLGLRFGEFHLLELAGDFNACSHVVPLFIQRTIQHRGCAVKSARHV